MYKIIIKNIENKYEYEELTKVFLNPNDFRLLTDEDLASEEVDKAIGEETEIIINESDLRDKNLIKAQLYDRLAEITSLRPEWGILTGVRPIKVAGELTRLHGTNQAESVLTNDYRLSPEKAKLISKTYLYQQITIGKPKANSIGLYIGIPFCPTRCLYCSFTSNIATKDKIEEYLLALHEEIDFVAQKIKQKEYFVESIYIGGGTPTTLEADQLESLLAHIAKAFDLSSLAEFTVEAGRPDTITEQKLKIIKSYGIERISINPQSMKQETLELIGRSHTPKMIEEALSIARKTKIPIINMDIIAGLPEESDIDFKNTLDSIIAFGVENITVHTLAVKRASRLIEQDKDYHYKQADTVKKMLAYARDTLYKNGYIPYYLYRQKHMAGNMENIGWCKPGTEGIYNIRIMEEAQTIVALGAGGISKRYYPDENRLERIPNVSNYEIYIERLAEMLERKEQNLF